MNVPLVDLQAQYASIKPEADAAIARVLASCAFAGGPEVEAFEKAFAAFCSAKNCMCLSSGTAALELLVRAYGIGPGDEVIIPSHTFYATAEGVLLAGAKPVFAEVLDGTALIDPVSIAKAVTPKTKAIIPVHLYGQPADMDPILEIAKKHNLIVIEDCCQAHGATYKGKTAGSLGHASAFSFYPGKNLGAYGEAGAAVTDDPKIAEFVRLFREHGSKTKYEHIMLGRNDRMDGIQGAVLAAKLPHLATWNEARRKHAKRYRELLKDEKRVRFIAEDSNCVPVYHLLVIRIADRDRVRSALNAEGIGAGIHYPIPLHLQAACKDLGWKKGDLPITETITSEILSLPLYPEMTDEHIMHVVTRLKALL